MKSSSCQRGAKVANQLTQQLGLFIYEGEGEVEELHIWKDVLHSPMDDLILSTLEARHLTYARAAG